MKRTLKVILCLALCSVMAFMPVSGAFAAKKNKYQSLTAAETNKRIAQYQQENQKLQSEITELKKQQNQQSAVLSALQKKISNIQAIINEYNAEISRINSVIAENKQKIAEKEDEIEKDKLEYKKRIRAIYMSGWDSSLKILLDAETFSDFLQLQKLTEAVGAKDKKVMEALAAEIAELDEINEENNQLLENQVAIKNEVKKQQDELKSQESEAASIYNDISKEVKDTKNEINANAAEIAELQRHKAEIEREVTQKGNASATFINPNTGFMWPVAGYYTISSPFGQRSSGFHSGMDIAGSGISGRPILAIADGVVYMANKSWTPSQGKSGYASYGNFCAVNHGTMTIGGSSAKYVAFYAHASSIIVSVGQSVKQGQVLGYVGTTGNSTGYHLHIGIQKNGSWVNPYSLLKG